MATTPIDQFKEHYEVNTLGPVVLFQAAHELLFKSPRPTFVIVSSFIGSIGNYYSGASSAA